MGWFDDIDPAGGLSRTGPTGSGLFDNLPEGPGPFAGGFKAGVAGIKAAGGGLRSMAGRAVGSQSMQDAGAAITAAANEEGSAYARTYRDVESVGDAIDFAKYGLGTALPSLLTTLAAAVAGRGLGALAARSTTEAATRNLIKNAGMVGGAAGSSVGLAAGGIYPEALEEGVDNPMGRAMAGGIVSGALDVVPEFYLARRLGMLGGVARGVPGGRIANAASQGTKQALMEGATEGLQTGVARTAAGQSLTDDEAREEFINSILIGAIAGGAIGAPVGALNAGRGATTPAAEGEAAPAVVPGVTPEQQAAVVQQAAIDAPSLVTEENRPLPELLAEPQEGLPGIDLDAADRLSQSDPRIAAANTEIAQNPERLAREFLEARRSTVSDPVDQATSRITALTAEMELPTEQRRKKGAIAKEMKQAQADLATRQEALAKYDSQIEALRTQEQLKAFDARTQEQLSTPRAEFATGTVLADESTQIPLDTQRKAASEAPGFARTAEEVLRLRGDAGLETLPAPEQPQPLVVPPERETQPRERLRQGTPQQKREAFIDESSRIIDREIKGLIDNKVIKETAGTKAATQIKRALEDVVAASDVEAAKDKLSESVATALKGRLNKVDAQTFADSLFSKLGEQPREFLSKGAVDKLAGTKVVDSTGQPLKVFHTTPNEFNKFKAGGDDVTKSGKAIWFGTDAMHPPAAHNIGRRRGVFKEGVRTIPAYINLQRPLIIDNTTRDWARELWGDNFPQLIGSETLADVRKDYDGVMYYDKDGKLTEIVAFDPDQIVNAIALDSRSALSDAQQAEIGRGVLDELNRMIGDASDLEVRLFVQRDPNSFAGRYRTTPTKDLIELAYNAKDVMSVAAHEAFHRIETKHLSGTERAILRRGLKKGSDFYNRVITAARNYDAANGTNITDEIESVPQEARAYGFEMWKRGELEVDGPLRRVFSKIKQLLERVRNYVDGLGFRSVEDLYRAVDMGQYARSGINPLMAVDSTKAYSLVDETEFLSRSETSSSAAFKKWFGSSKVVDAEGKPLVVYHGTDAEFDAFDNAKIGSRTDPGFFGAGHYFVDNEANAARWGNRTIAAYVALENPLVVSGITDFVQKAGQRKTEGKQAYAQEMQRVTSDLISKGYDGVMYRRSDGTTQVIAFRPEQIKSAIGNQGTFDPTNPNILLSKAALNDSITEIVQAAQQGSAEPTQIISSFAKAIDGIDLPKSTYKDLIGAHSEASVGKLARGYLNNISSGMNIARRSNGFKNHFDVITAYEQRKNRLIAEGVDVKLSMWQDRKTTSTNIENVSKALLARTVDGVRHDSKKITDILSGLTPYEKDMFWQASKMIGDRLDAEFVADQRSMRSALGEDTEAYKEWFVNRSTQIQRLKDEGYVPERRFGDHVVYATIPMKDAQGRTTNITVLREQFESPAKAKLALLKYQEALAGNPEIKVGYEQRYKAEHDASLSFQQFLDIANRFGIEVSQAEKERLAKTMISADSVRRNRIFRRKNVAGFSEDGLRVLSEFAVTMANKIAYSEFSKAMGDSQRGRPVEVTRAADGSPVLTIDERSDLWATDGPNAGFYRTLADRMSDFVLQPQRDGEWSRKARAAASLHFLGGSVAAGVVNLSALPMVSIPVLSAHAKGGYTSAFAKVTSGFMDAVRNPVLRDLAKLQDRTVSIPAIDSVPGLREQLIRAAEDGTTLDTEIYQIMGQSRGSMLSKSRKTRRAMEIWMYPFRTVEQINRISSFIAGYKVGVENKLGGDALYKFAQKMVHDSQNRYDEANRPALARDPIWAVLFTFKSFPIFMTETIVALHKEKPQAAVFMLLSLAVAAGVNGMPFAEDFMDMIDTVAQRLFNSPFNSQRALKNALKSASEAMVGVDLSGVFLNGLVNEMTGMSFASRVGLGNLIPGTRLGAADSDYSQVVQEVFGPVGSMVDGVFKAAASLTKGDFEKAWLQGAPLAGKNLAKGIRQGVDGFASDIGGRKLGDVSGMEALVQGFGFSSAGINRLYEMDRIDKQSQAFYQMVQKDFMSDIVGAVKENNPERIRETLQAVAAWNKAYPAMPIVIRGSSVRRQVAESGMSLNQRTLMNLPRALRQGSEAYELTRNQ
jgi:hypothetical protein